MSRQSRLTLLSEADEPTRNEFARLTSYNPEARLRLVIFLRRERQLFLPKVDVGNSWLRHFVATFLRTPVAMGEPRFVSPFLP